MGLFLSTTERDLLGCWVGLLMGEPSAKKLADAGVDWKKLVKDALALLPELSSVLSNAGDGSLPNIFMEVSDRTEKTFSALNLIISFDYHLKKKNLKYFEI